MKDLFFAARIVVLLFASFLFGDHLLATDYSFWGGMLYILLASIGLSAFLGFLEWILDIRDSFWIAGLLLPLLGLTIVWMCVSSPEGIFLVAMLAVAFFVLRFIWSLVKALFWGC
ncbi:hypothetical protein HQ40_08920 [Porphyromonas gulae]|uniref:hypothetical protein n=1 Tax=Porphyromonas gulae TaxID=111105 RepID=UPI00052CF056|nr:hypothetical protein [Porphyromonas gulae]KGN68963.1 hypothetical protein HR09_05000 [Porphyromonas gulae]KGN73606.1 hypothetical protein HQ40_08920 [Porphyromonas gulae]KGN88492.1 hypothetical protein HQ46_07055 [Porphyromonas gulae]